MTAEYDSLLGKTFDGYRIEKPLGVGGMAKVYRALDVKLKRYVAIKVIAHDFRDQPEYTLRFEREAQSIARLEHPNIVRIYRFGETDEMYYMAMQYIEGADLAALIRNYNANGEVMPIADVVRVVKDIGAALDFAHSHDVIHRDVKSGNIMVDQEGRALLTDFGLALLSDIGTRGEILGSPHYISPEQAVSSANVVPQSDLYSLGVTLFEMLTGDLPFVGDEVMDLTLRQMTEAPPPPSQINAALSPSIDAVVLRALEKEPYDRFASGAELSAALEEAVADWQVSESSSQESVRRPSLVLLPHKVREQMQVSPVPSIPTAPSPTRVAAPNETPTTEAAQGANARKRWDTAQTPDRNRWRGALVFAFIIFLVGAGLIVALRPSTAETAEPASTEVADMPATPSQPVAIVIASPEPTATVYIEPTPIPPTPTAVPPTNTLIPTATPFVPTPVPATPISWHEILIARRGEDSLVIVNMSFSSLSLAPLRLGDQGAIDGSEWNVDALAQNQCVIAIKDRGNARLPDLTCTELGTRVTRGGRDRFWKESFNVYYAGNFVGTCDSDICFIAIHG